MTGATTAIAGPRAAGRAIGTFLVLLFLFSAVADALIVHVHKEPPMLDRLLMWCPGAAALVTCSLHRLPLATLGWRWPSTRWLAIAYAIPLLYAFPVYGAAWSSIAGSLTPGIFLNTTAGQYGFESRPGLATTLVGVPLLATVGVLASVTWALGEELGWRGFLLPRLTERIGFKGAALASGLIWAAWHYPALLWGEYNAGTDPAYAIGCFTCMAVAMAFVLGWLRLHSASVWPCALLHASHNVVIQGILDPLTSDVGTSRLVTTEFGFGLALAIGITAAIVLIRRPISKRPS